MGQWFFTGSQEAPLMHGVSESMAGRAAIFQLLPLSLSESQKVSLLHGGYPEVLARPGARALWFSSYLQTYLERDVRAITNVRDLMTFRRFLAVLATRHGQMLNKTEIASPLGISVPTVTEWLHVLEITNQILLVPPYFENYGKRLVKAPKFYWTDPGMACYLLGIQTQAELDRSPFLGPIFEGMVAMEIIKSQINRAQRPELYHFRDQQGLEVDFLVPRPGGKLWFVEAKASKTVRPAMAGPLLALQKSAVTKASRLMVIHRAAVNGPETLSIAPGARALSLAAFSELLVSTQY
jgi:predicted AAA+ superfamily ATPase